MSQRPPMKYAERVSSLLKQLLDRPGLGEQITRHQAWLILDKLVGEQIAARARPLRLRKGVLEVQVDHPVWMQQLQMMKPQILEKIAEKIPNAGITDIYLRQSHNMQGFNPVKKRPTPEPPAWTQVQLSAAELARIDAELAGLENRELRAELKNLRIRQKQLEKSRAQD